MNILLYNFIDLYLHSFERVVAAVLLAESGEPASLSTYLIPITIITVLVIINGIFVAAEFALAASQYTRMTQLVEAGKPAARNVLKILRSPKLINQYLSTAQIGITIATLGLGMYGEHTLAHWIEEAFPDVSWIGEAAIHTVSILIAIFLITYLHVVIGEMVPKSLALQSPNESAIRLNGVMTFFDRLFFPLSFVLNGIGDGLLRMAGVPPMDAASRLISSEELEFIVAESSEEGLLAPSEQLFMENILDFQDRNIGQVMTPRTRLVGISIDATLPEVLDIVGENGFSRYPVYKDDMDHVHGILHIKDISRFYVDDAIANNEFTPEKAMRPVIFVPESVSLGQMLGQFQHEHMQVAMVVDEYGGVDGMVSMEDLVEELVGEIQDGDENEIVPFRQLEEGLLRVRGDLLLDELEQHFELDLNDDDADTIGGFVMALLGRVPDLGDSVESENVRFEIESMDGLAVGTVLIDLRNRGIEE